MKRASSVFSRELKHLLTTFVLLTFLLPFSFSLSAQQKLPPLLPDLQKWIDNGNELFQKLKADTFPGKQEDGMAPYFKWTSDKKEEARYPGYRNSPEWRFLKYIVPEVILSFGEDGKLSRINVSIYNPGDCTEISPEEFKSICDAVTSYLNEKLQVKNTSRKSKLTGDSTISQNVWCTEKLQWVLRSSSSGKGKKYRNGFIQLVVEPVSADSKGEVDIGTSMKRSEVKRGTALTQNVKREPDGSVFVDNIPMVDQGMKGYCAVAVAERVIRYFGDDTVTQHSLAQIAGTDPSVGTNQIYFSAALKRISGKFSLRYKVRYERFTADMTIKDLEKIIARYNSAAKKLGRNKIQLVEHDRVIYINETLNQMEFPVVYAMRLAEKNDIKKFYRDIKELTEKGVPVIWRVTLGLVPEEKLSSQTAGGHLRLIIGYNDKKKEIIFSDTWGAGHERKNMKFDDAWVITDAYMSLEPR